MVGSSDSPITVGILALQGAYKLHADALRTLDGSVDTQWIRKPADLVGIDGIILPGGESTVLTKLLSTADLEKPLRDLINGGMPTLATCAGLILLCNILDVLDVDVVRNAYGAQVDSFETDVDYLPSKEKAHVHFIRAPRISRVGDGVDVIAVHESETVGVARDNIVGLTFHPEVAGETLFHKVFVENIMRRLAS